MNLKKYLVKIIAIILFSVFVVVQASCIYAQDVTPGQWFGAIALMDEKVGYSLNAAPNGENASRIWNIVKYTGSNHEQKSEEDTIYCAKAGVGFSNEQGRVTDGSRKKEYNASYDMKKDDNEIKNKYKAQQKLVKTGVAGTKYSRYSALLALLDRLYIINDKNESNDIERKALINKIISEASTSEEYVSEYWDDIEGDIKKGTISLTDYDIDATQQAAIWYFTNYEDSQKYDCTDCDKKDWLYITGEDEAKTRESEYTYKALSQATNGQARSYETKILYNYLIKEAIEHAKDYNDPDAETLNKIPIEIEQTKLTSETNQGKTTIGPINVKKNNNRPFTIELKVTNNGSEIQDYKLLDSQKTEVNLDDYESEITTIEDVVGNGSFYIQLQSETAIKDFKVEVTVNYDEYDKKEIKFWAHNTDNTTIQPLIEIHKTPKSQTFTLNLEEEKPFDLALRKYITKLEDKDGNDKTIPNSRDTNNIVTDELKSGAKTTAEYKHRKDPVIVETGDKVTYNITIYNEGSKKGYASKVIDQLPDGLEYVENSLNSGNYEVKEDGYDKTTNRLTLTRKDSANDPLEAYTNGTPAHETITIQCEVKAAADSNKSKVLTNVAWIAEAYDAEEGEKKVTNDDRDSQPETTPKIGNDEVNKDNMENYKGSSDDDDLTNNDYYYKGQQDDDDFEKLAIVPESFDLKLIKFITKVNNQNVPNRVESVDVSKLNTFANGQMVTTADYKLDKTPVPVKKGDIVTYKFRIYNEGTIDGYAEKITEDVPEGLQFMWSSNQGTALEGDATLTDAEKEAIKLNQDYLWGFEEDDMDENGKVTMVSTDFLSKNKNGLEGDSNLIKAFGENDGKKTEKDLHYKEIQIAFKVIAENASKDIIRNEAAITNDADSNGDSVDDRDSNTDIWGKDPSGDFYDEKKEWPKYKEDDEDYDNIMLKEFDLALRKFITKKENNVVDSRIPRPSYDSQNDKITYEHGKDPLTVVSGNTVEYTIRIFNEGTRDGYAAQVLDDIPDGLVFLPDNETNVKYRWVMYRKLKDGEDATKVKDNTIVQDGETYVKTDDPSEAEVIVTDYLSMEQNKDNLLKAFDKTADITDTNPDHKDVKVAFKVVEPNSSDRVIVNSAQISKDTDENGNEVEDKDSIPGEWNEGEDDQDKEYIELREFDLALRKWVTQAIVIENGKQTVTATGHQPWDDPEQVVKVEIVHSKLNSVTVKFRYSIRVINQGDIEGYAKEVTDYVPEGLKFVAEDNPGWTDEGNNVISTRLLENTLLKPGEYADVEVLLTWINSENGLGTVLTNTAEISEDYNEYGAPDKDSDPDNKKPGEDDIDDAPVILSIKTGQIRIYFTLGFVILITTACGIVLIKRYVI